MANNIKDNLLRNEVPKQEFIRELTNEQKKKILDRWNDKDKDPPSSKELSLLVFGVEYDGRERAVQLIKKYLSTFGFAPKITLINPRSDLVINLTDEQKEYIANNCSRMTSVEIARELFNNRALSNLHKETKAVGEYSKSLPNVVLYQNDIGLIEDDGTTDERYCPPKTVDRAASRINKYIIDCIKPEEVKSNTKIQQCLQSLIRSCHMFRFKMIMGNFKNRLDRDLFEASYIRFVWDKPDLTQEDLDLVCNLCIDIVNYTNMQKELEDLKEMRDNLAQDTEGRRISMSIVESIANIRKEMDDNHKRQSSIIKTLQGTRDTRMENKLKMSASFLQLVEAWREEQKRVKFLKIAENKRVKLKEEINRLESIDSLKAEIWGVNKNMFD